MSIQGKSGVPADFGAPLMAFANPFDAADFLFAVRTAIRGVNLQPLCLSSGRCASSQRCLHERHCIYILQTASPLLHITIIPFTCRQFHISRKEDKYLYNGVVLRSGSAPQRQGVRIIIIKVMLLFYLLEKQRKLRDLEEHLCNWLFNRFFRYELSDSFSFRFLPFPERL